MPAAKLFGEPSRLIQMYSIANVCFCFELAKEKAKTLLLHLHISNIKLTYFLTKVKRGVSKLK